MQNNRKNQEYKQNQNQDSAMQGTFLIRKADETDVVGIMKVMNEAQGDKEHPDWFVADNEDYIRAHLKEHGFVVVAESSEEEIAGFFLIKYPENKEDNLGTYLDFDEEQLVHVAVMDCRKYIQRQWAAGTDARSSREFPEFGRILLSDVYDTS
jgi:hypothetical protein